MVAHNENAVQATDGLDQVVSPVSMFIHGLLENWLLEQKETGGMVKPSQGKVLAPLEASAGRGVNPNVTPLMAALRCKKTPICERA